MGPQVEVERNISKLETVYGIAASFSVLLQLFYKISQDQNKKISAYTTRIEGALYHITLKYPDRLESAAMEGHLRELLFHGIKKGIRDSLCYLSDNPSGSYTQLVVATRKNDSKMSGDRGEK